MSLEKLAEALSKKLPPIAEKLKRKKTTTVTFDTIMEEERSRTSINNSTTDVKLGQKPPRRGQAQFRTPQ